MSLFGPPAHLDDFGRRPAEADAFARGWDAVVDMWFDKFAGIEGGGFYNPARDDTPGRPDRQSVAWDAFPRPVSKWFETEDDPDATRFQAAETLRPRLFGDRPLRRVVDGSLAEPVPVVHRQQDEYCEWFASRDADGRIDRVTFTSEAPDYWRFLALGTSAFFPGGDERAGIVDGDIGLVAELYREHVDPSVAVDDLVWPYDVAAYDATTRRWSIYGRAGTYNPFNRWNTTSGAMHLTHPANTLHGEFVVAGRAAVLRKDADGRPVDDAEALVCCSGFGEPNRSSDPSIGAAVNGLVKDGLSVALADPVGLYIAGINLDAFSGPGGEDVSAGWRVDRGDAASQMILRATFAPPPGAGYTVDQIQAGGVPIRGGGQIADEVQMILTGLAKRRGPGSTTRQPCVTRCCEHPERPGVVAVIDRRASCTTVDWAARAPALEPPAEQPGPAGLAGVEVVEVLAEPDPGSVPPAMSR